MYTFVVSPILSHGAIVWWSRLGKKYNSILLNRIRRTASAGVTEALQSCSVDALKVLLHFSDKHSVAEAYRLSGCVSVAGTWSEPKCNAKRHPNLYSVGTFSRLVGSVVPTEQSGRCVHSYAPLGCWSQEHRGDSAGLGTPVVGAFGVLANVTGQIDSHYLS